MNFKKKHLAAALMLVMSCGFAHAQTDAAKATGSNAADTSMKAAQDQLAASFSGMNISGFKESPIEGIFEVRTGGNTIYFHPGLGDKKGVLIFGEMFDSSGVNLTEQSKMAGMTDILKSLPLDSAITVGPKDAPVFYEFTDPDCPYCHAYDQWLTTYAKDHPVQRKLIFMVNPGHPLARAKIEHVICSEDKDEAVRYVYSEELPHAPDGANAMQNAKQAALKTCKEADAVIQQHAKIIQAVGVNGTPSFLFNADSNPNLIVGFSQQKIAEAITQLEMNAKSKQTKPTEKTTK
ncbi:DsbC family protein [Salmonella enterica]|nr:DsbC family protein [Salmonella enterica subsp. enterica]EDV1188893.1 DsbC family protein [Salmonella enterica subsp. enterica]EIY8279332.1 DsbC family protein [Salmonella enterica]